MFRFLSDRASERSTWFCIAALLAAGLITWQYGPHIWHAGLAAGSLAGIAIPGNTINRILDLVAKMADVPDYHDIPTTQKQEVNMSVLEVIEKELFTAIERSVTDPSVRAHEAAVVRGLLAVRSSPTSATVLAAIQSILAILEDFAPAAVAPEQSEVKLT